MLRLFLQFANAYRDGNGCLLVFMHEGKELKVDMMTYVETYDFTIVKKLVGHQ